MNLRIAICDDKEAELNTIEKHLEHYLIQHDDNIVIDRYLSGKDLLAVHKLHPYNVIFLDIEMPRINGIKVAQIIRNQLQDHTFLIFTTSYPKYMQDSFDVQPFQFLTKPISYLSVEQIIKKIKMKLEKSTFATILIGEDGEEYLVPLNDIKFISISKERKHYVCFHLIDRDLQVKGSLTEFENSLFSKGFISPSRGYLLNIRQIKSFNGTRVVLKSDESLPVSRRQAKFVKDKYMNHIIEIIS